MKLPVFVIQKHDARTLHYDFRLEADGVLKSFVVPKGPSLDPHEKRLAIRTPDHPLAYADFEGVIPEGEEGAGVVLIWDRGVYLNLTTADDGKTPVPVAEALRKGHLSVEIKGKKLQGGFAFHRMGTAGISRWILIKMNDTFADPGRDPVSDQPGSVKTGLLLEEFPRQGAVPNNG